MATAGYAGTMPYPHNGLSQYSRMAQGKRSLDGPEAHQVPVPHPSQRQQPPPSYYLLDDESFQSCGPPPWVPFYMRDSPIVGTFYPQGMTQAAVPPLETEFMGLADPDKAAKKRADMAAKLDKLSAVTIKELLLEASLRNFTVADQVELEHQKVVSPELRAAGSSQTRISPHPASPLTGITINPQPLAAVNPNAAPPRTGMAVKPALAVTKPRAPKKKPQLHISHYNDASWHQLTRYDHLSSSQRWAKSIPVGRALEKMFKQIADSVAQASDFEDKRLAMTAMLAIYNNCFDCIDSEIGKEMRNDCHEWAPYFLVVLNMVDEGGLRRLATEPCGQSEPIAWIESLRYTWKTAKSYCVPLEGELRKVLDRLEKYEDREGQPRATGSQLVILD